MDGTGPPPCPATCGGGSSISGPRPSTAGQVNARHGTGAIARVAAWHNLRETQGAWTMSCGRVTRTVS